MLLNQLKYKKLSRYKLETNLILKKNQLNKLIYLLSYKKIYRQLIILCKH